MLVNYENFFCQNIRGFKLGLNDQATGLCPLHKDRNPSFSVNLKDGLWKCHGGECGQSGNAYQLAKLLGIDPPEKAPHDQPSREVAKYIYQDEKGQLLFMVKRYEPKTFRQFRFEAGQWMSGLNGTRRVLYNLPGIVSAQTVYITEGEKDAETLKAWGLPATTNPMGALKWLPEYSETLKGKNVVILPDQDEPGQKHARDVASKLWGKAKAIKIVNVPAGKDPFEWKERGGMKEALTLLVKETPVLTNPPSEPQDSKHSDSIILTRLADVEPEEVSWLWPQRIAKGKLTIIIGDPGLGKSFATLDIASRVSTGISWPDENKTPKGQIILIECGGWVIGHDKAQA